MIERIRWLGHDSFRIDAERTIYVDPWRLEEDAPPADLILISHEHPDHCSPEDVAKISRAETVIVTTADVASRLEGQPGEVRIVEPGDTLTARGIQVEIVPAYNVSKFRSPGQPFHPKEAGHLGFIVIAEGQRIYHAGDTDNIPEMDALEVDVALLPVSGVYVMTAEEAADAARRIKPRIAVPMHYAAGVAGTIDDARRFAELYDGEVVILEQE